VDQTFAGFQPIALSLFRFITGLLLFQYGVAELLKFPAGNPFEKVELFSLIGAAGVLELVLGGLLMIGLFSRIVASSWRAKWRLPISSNTFRAAFIRSSTTAPRRSCALASGPRLNQ
jgi:hypothetical protein